MHSLESIPVGIDALNFYTAPYYLDLAVLAQQRGLAEDYFAKSIGQEKMSVPSPDEDIVTLACNAAAPLFKTIQPSRISQLIFATETGIDQSKSAGLYVHKLLSLPASCRVIEVKQACYGATGILQMAMDYLRTHPDEHILLIASDIARYDSGTVAEPSQGCGAIAMLLSQHPRTAVIDPETGVYTEEAMDFWRPNYRREALVDGKLSVELYHKLLQQTFAQYQTRSGRTVSNHAAFCYHIPVPRLVEQAHRRLVRSASPAEKQLLNTRLHAALKFSRHVGNCYTASLYFSLLSLLMNTSEDLSQQRVGLYSYGSGSVGEYFSLVLQPHYQTVLQQLVKPDLLNARIPLTYDTYQDFFNFTYPTDGAHTLMPKHHSGPFRLHAIDNHKRQYEYIG